MKNNDFEFIVHKTFNQVSVWCLVKDVMKQPKSAGTAFFTLLSLLASAICFYKFAFEQNNIYVTFAFVAASIIFLLFSFYTWNLALNESHKNLFESNHDEIIAKGWNRSYLRFLKFKTMCEDDPNWKNLKIDEKKIEGLAKIIKAECEYKEVEWGVADAFRKLVFGLSWTFLFVIFIYAFTGQDFTSYLINNLSKYFLWANTNPSAGIIFTLLVISLFVSIACLSIREKKKMRELLMFLTWWKEKYFTNV